MRNLLAIAVSSFAIALTLFGGGCGGASSSGSSPDRTVYSFVHALKHQNYGRACSYMTRDFGGPVKACAEGWAGNVAMGLMFGIPNVFEDLTVMPGSKVVVDEDTVIYEVGDRRDGVNVPDGIPPTLVVVEKQESGNWRVTQIDGEVPEPDTGTEG